METNPQAAATTVVRCPQCGQINRIPSARRDDGPKCGQCRSSLAARGQVGVVDDAGLAALLQRSPVPVLVDFYADWCGPCRTLAPVLQQLAAEYEGKLLVVKVDTDRSQGFASQLGVQGIPAVHLFVGGRHVAEESGTRPAPFWRQFLAPHLG